MRLASTLVWLLSCVTLIGGVQLPEARQEGPEAEKSWKSKRIKYAKIGAAASGAAALMVITGEVRICLSWLTVSVNLSM